MWSRDIRTAGVDPHLLPQYGGLCSIASPNEAALQDAYEEQMEVIETMIEVEAEDKANIRTLKKEMEVLDIILDQYESAVADMGAAIPEETLARLQKLSKKRQRHANERKRAMSQYHEEEEQHIKLVRPSDDKIKRAQSRRELNKLKTAHEESSYALGRRWTPVGRKRERECRGAYPSLVIK